MSDPLRDEVKDKSILFGKETSQVLENALRGRIEAEDSSLGERCCRQIWHYPFQRFFELEEGEICIDSRGGTQYAAHGPLAEGDCHSALRENLAASLEKEGTKNDGFYASQSRLLPDIE